MYIYARVLAYGVGKRLLNLDVALDLLVFGAGGMFGVSLVQGFTLGDLLLVMLVIAVGVLLLANFRLRKGKKSAESREKVLLNEKELIDKFSLLKVELYQNMYHDLKTPLTVISTSILNMSDMIEFGDTNEDEMLKSLGDIQSETMYMSRMLDNAMKLSSSQIGQHDLLFVPMDIGEFIIEKSEIYRILLARSKNKLVLDIATPLPKVMVCADMILHVLTNLLTNANRYTRAGEITISVKEEQDDVCITVGDNGSGIKAELLPLIFKRGTSDGSTGLGLAICKDVVEKTHGGKISATSEVGVGTKITFTLPKYYQSEGADYDGRYRKRILAND